MAEVTLTRMLLFKGTSFTFVIFLVGNFGVILGQFSVQKAAAPFNGEDCLCQCDSLTFRTKWGQIQGNCKRYFCFGTILLSRSRNLHHKFQPWLRSPVVLCQKCPRLLQHLQGFETLRQIQGTVVQFMVESESQLEFYKSGKTVVLPGLCHPRTQLLQMLAVLVSNQARRLWV